MRGGWQGAAGRDRRSLENIGIKWARLGGRYVR